MADWTRNAKEYLEGYLGQVAALTRHQGDDADDIVSGLRDHVYCEVENTTSGTVEIDSLLELLDTIGSPKEVANLETPLRGPSRAGEQKKEPWYRAMSGCAVAAIVALLIVPVVFGGLLVIMIFFLAAENIPDDTADPAKLLKSCTENLRTIDDSLREYADEHSSYYPPLSEIPGQLMFSADALSPDSLDNMKALFCPRSKFNGAMKLPVNALDDHSYYYLGRAVTNESEGLAFVEAYRNAVQAGIAFDIDFMSADGSIIPLITGGFLVDERDPETAKIPVMIEIPEHHEVLGGNVLFLDGHVEFMELDEGFPMTRRFIEALKSIDK